MANGELIPIIGSPGSGKSKLSTNIINRFGPDSSVDTISLGDAMRERKLARVCDMSDDRVAAEVLLDELQEREQTDLVLLNGFPKNENQIKWLLRVLKETERTVPAVFQLKVSPNTAARRMLKRSEVKHGRIHTPEDVDYRLAYYQQHGQAVIRALAAEFGYSNMHRFDTEHDSPEINAVLATALIGLSLRRKAI